MALTITHIMESVKTEFTASGWSNGTQMAPDVLALSNGGFVVAYNNGSLSNGFMMLDFYDANHNLVASAQGPYAGVHTDAIGEPSLIELANGNVAVVWDDNNDEQQDAGIQVSIFSPAGSLIVQEKHISFESVNYTGVDVTALSNGNFVVSSGYAGNFNNISFKILDSSGNEVKGFTQVNTSDDGTQKGSQVTALDSGGFAVGWITDTGNGFPDVTARVYNAAGTALKTISLSTSATDFAMVGLKDGGFAVVLDDISNTQDFSLKIVKADGTVVPSTSTIGWDPANHPGSQPDITQLDSGHILVTWTREYSATDKDIYGALFDANGEHVQVNGQWEFVMANTGMDEIKSAIDGFADSSVITAWQDESGTSISARIDAFVNIVKGDNAADTYTGDGLRDEIEGGGGKDTLSGAGGDDYIDGGSGNDILNGGGGHDTIYGGLDNDIIFGAVGDDSSTWMEGDQLSGEDGDDTILGFWGDDLIDGGTGKDTINAQDGDDVIYIEKGDVVAGEAIDGGNGDDVLHLAASNVSSIVSISGAALYNIEKVELGGAFSEPTTFVMDADQFWGPNETMTIDGLNNQKDQIIINMGASTNANLFLLDMQLSVFPGKEDSVYIVGDGDAETIRGTQWAETISGNGGADKLYASNGDKLYGGDGDDTLFDANGHVAFDGGKDIDTVSYAYHGAVKAYLDGLAVNNGDASADSFVSIENLIGSAKDDSLGGTSGVNVLDGGLGNDILYGGDGGDTLIGGEGIDTAHYSGADAGVIASLANPAINAGFAKGDSYVSIENLSGSKYDDALNGDNAVNTIRGGYGDDRIKGYGGNDILFGDAGADKFIFNSALDAATNVDTVADFDAAEDTIQLDDAIFTALKSLGVLDASFFRANATGLPADANDYIVYETDTGKLFYDADGNGANFAGVQFATLTGLPSITAADFEVI
ncbi:hypothetical protein [Mesorhizobium sp. CN2-181]|uniref:calcium-binding protein n=1 Tax=Mesorhizobium yinganensis TaxID=3157707 RepID=UPI0032B8023C